MPGKLAFGERVTIAGSAIAGKAWYIGPYKMKNGRYSEMTGVFVFAPGALCWEIPIRGMPVGTMCKGQPDSFSGYNLSGHNFIKLSMMHVKSLGIRGLIDFARVLGKDNLEKLARLLPPGAALYTQALLSDLAFDEKESKAPEEGDMVNLCVERKLQRPTKAFNDYASHLGGASVYMEHPTPVEIGRLMNGEVAMLVPIGIGKRYLQECSSIRALQKRVVDAMKEEE